MSEFLIEDGVPLDRSRRGGAPGVYGKVRKTMRKLEVGQSFAIFGEAKYHGAHSAQRLEYLENGKRFVIQRESEPGFRRVWRIE